MKEFIKFLKFIKVIYSVFILLAAIVIIAATYFGENVIWQRLVSIIFIYVAIDSLICICEEKSI